MIFIIILVLLVVLALGVYLYKILKEETVVIEKEKEEEKIEKQKSIDATYVGKIKKFGLDQVINDVKGNPEEIEKLKAEVQAKLRKATRENNAEKVREINDLLKKIDKSL